MRLLLQRASHGKVVVDGKTIGEIEKGLVVLAGFGQMDTLELPGTKLWNTLIDKMLGLRIFPDENDKMNLSLADYGGDILIVSQFTLYADCKRGKRPSFSGACAPAVAEQLYNKLVQDVGARFSGRVATGQFAAMMDVDLVNWGPVTILLDSADF